MAEEDAAGIALRFVLAIPTVAVGIAALVVAYRSRPAQPQAANLFAAGAVVTIAWTALEYAIYDWPNLSLMLEDAGLGFDVSFTLFWGLEQAAHCLALLLFAGAFLARRDADRPPAADSRDRFDASWEDRRDDPFADDFRDAR